MKAFDFALSETRYRQIMKYLPIFSELLIYSILTTLCNETSSPFTLSENISFSLRRKEAKLLNKLFDTLEFPRLKALV